MRHFPTYCSHCRRSFVIAEGALQQGLHCAKCGRSARLIPSAYYHDDAAELFVEVEAAVSAARLSDTRLKLLNDELECADAGGCASAAGFRQLLTDVGLQELGSAVPEEVPARRRYIGIWLTVVRPLAEPVVTHGSGVQPILTRDLFATMPRKSDSA